MAETTVTVTFKPVKGAASLPQLKSHILLVESLLDASGMHERDVTTQLETDYSDDALTLVATWEI